MVWERVEKISTVLICDEPKNSQPPIILEERDTKKKTNNCFYLTDV